MLCVCVCVLCGRRGCLRTYVRVWLRVISTCVGEERTCMPLCASSSRCYLPQTNISRARALGDIGNFEGNILCSVAVG